MVLLGLYLLFGILFLSFSVPQSSATCPILKVWGEWVGAFFLIVFGLKVLVEVLVKKQGNLID